ncbi:MAG TPA: choice-of-anchor R domain-containing protein [Lacunisphaera sp.]|nr:choice-of-anchor R domain-containing protein [Lacunisphaera sp.]
MKQCGGYSSRLPETSQVAPRSALYPSIPAGLQRVAALWLAFGLVAVARLRGQDALSNLGQPLYGGNFVAGAYVNGFKIGDAVQFTTGPEAVYFTGATFPFFLNPALGYSPATGLEVSLNSGFGPSGSTGLIAMLNGPSAPSVGSTASFFSYTPSTPILLAPETRYWLQLDAFTTANNTYLQWSGTTNIGGIDAGGLAGWTYADPVSFDVNYYFTNSGGGANAWSGNTAAVAAPMFSVQYAPVPEPTAAGALVGLAAIGTAVRLRGRSKFGHKPRRDESSRI